MLNQVDLMTSGPLRYGRPKIGASNFKEDLRTLFLGALGLEGGRSGHMIKYDYSSLIYPGFRDSGGDLWERVTKLGSDSKYYIPMAEGVIIDRNMNYFDQLFASRPVVIDFGPGGEHAVGLKSLPTFRAVNGREYIAFDINEEFAMHAANLVGRKTNAITHHVYADFTEECKLNVEAPVLMTMYGCTISQFPLQKRSNLTETTAQELLENLGRMVDHNAILVATIDANLHPDSAVDCYTGQHFRGFKNNFWRNAKLMVEQGADPRLNVFSVDGSSSVDPASAMLYHPDFIVDTGVVHTYHTQKPLMAIIEGERFDIQAGTQFVTGYSEKWDIDSIIKPANKAGWKLANVLTDGSRTVKAIVLAGKNVSEEQLARAQFGSPLINRSSRASRPAMVGGAVAKGHKRQAAKLKAA